ncbi:MAG: LysR family transcriptional regulator [Verrucomicrobia bacterium]|nr:LysR family transcriptional regulator [Verrucomicrobiota bacterium]
MEWLNYHHLLYFWAVAKEGGLRKASEKLNVSQPSISTQIRLLEEALGEKLFQRKGRTQVLTETGQFALGYADDIFSLGAEFISAVRQQAPARKRAIRLAIGVEDSFPKLLSYEILKPVLGLDPPVQLVCREGKPEELLAQLAVHRLDAILADEPATGTMKFKAFSHLLGKSTVAICATRKLARVLRDGFPRSLHQAPALLPTSNTTLRRSLDEWFQAIGIQPRVVAEFEDGALMKLAAADGMGFIAVPLVTLSECVTRFQFEKVGQTDRCNDQYYLITGERRVTHPAVLLMSENARSLVFS